MTLVIATVLFLGGGVQELQMPREKCEAIVGALKAGGEVWAHDRESSLTLQIIAASCREAASS